MNGPRVKVWLHTGQDVRGTLVGPENPAGPSRILIDSTWPARDVDRADWELLPESEQDGGGNRA